MNPIEKNSESLEKKSDIEMSEQYDGLKNNISNSIFDPENKKIIDVLKKSVCRDGTQEEFAMFLEACRATGLNPFLHEIWFFKIRGRVSIMAGRDGFLKIANQNPNYDGMESEVIYPNNDITKAPIGAVAKVYRKDRKIPIKVTVPFREYYKDNSESWKTYTSAMILKVAESMALKRAFSISGLVSSEEMGGRNAEEVMALADYDADIEKKQEIYFEIKSFDKGEEFLKKALADANVEKVKQLPLKTIEDILDKLKAPKEPAPSMGKLKSKDAPPPIEEETSINNKEEIKPKPVSQTISPQDYPLNEFNDILVYLNTQMGISLSFDEAWKIARMVYPELNAKTLTKKKLKYILDWFVTSYPPEEVPDEK